jgi:hypothetical protein
MVTAIKGAHIFWLNLRLNPYSKFLDYSTKLICHTYITQRERETAQINYEAQTKWNTEPRTISENTILDSYG